uniref:DUF1604 domain-containing protein n=3 Tax=Mesocestoides corti TaxID=53468 RepID=A0A5K3EJL6_MESCO
EDTFVTYGEPFDEDDADKSKFFHPKVRPQAYEQRVLNERGRPARFHGAFTGGFSAGYFNTVGSKEGFRPQPFTSSRRNRGHNADHPAQPRPEDFMDEEDLGEFGIAPRHYRTRREYDDRHIFNTLSESLGGKSIIPNANDILKRMLIPSATSMADRLLRRMGWKCEEITTALTEDEDESNRIGSCTERDYAVINFTPKANTFGLGYSGLDPEIALGRRAPTLRRDPQSESVDALQRRTESRSEHGFNPSTNLVRQGIRGQAFGVGALHSEDADIYAQESLASYDFSIGAGDENDGDDGDDEMAELEAARHGRFSDLRKRSKEKATTIDGWTPPTLPKVSISGVEEEPTSNVLEGFLMPVDSGACLVLANTEFFVMPEPVILPPGYSPIFHPECLGDSPGSPKPTEFTEKDSVFKLLRPEDKQYLEQRVEEARKLSMSSSSPSMPSNAPLLRPFTSDSAKQARFESYQVLVRRGIPHEVAYQRCSSEATDLSAETRQFEANVFATLLKNLTHTPAVADASKPWPSNDHKGDKKPLSAGILDTEKQRLVSNLLKSRFRSAGEMDITKELTEAQEEERRKEITSLDMTDPRDNAAVNDSYGVLTRRKLLWHPAALLCKRVNVPNPYPDSTFVGCPEDRRFRRPPRRGKRRRDDVTSTDFTLFQLLDLNVGSGEGQEGDEYGTSSGSEAEQEGSKEREEEEEILAGPTTQSKLPGGPTPTIFDALFSISGGPQKTAEENKGSAPDSSSPSEAAPRVIGPTAAPIPTSATTGDDSGLPQMDLFKSIFASDEETDNEDEEVEEEEELQPPPQPSSEAVPASMATRDQCDEQEPSTQPPPSTPTTTVDAPQPPSSTLSVHQLFSHLFNPGMDGDAPLFAVSKVTQQKAEEKRAHEEKASAAAVVDDFYGPALPPHFEPTPELTTNPTVQNYSLPASSSSVVFVERDKSHKDRSGKERRSSKHSHSHKHHKHKHNKHRD